MYVFIRNILCMFFFMIIKFFRWVLNLGFMCRVMVRFVKGVMVINFIFFVVKIGNVIIGNKIY